MKLSDIKFFGKSYAGVSNATILVLLLIAVAIYAISLVGMFTFNGWLIPVWFILTCEFSRTYEDDSVKDYTLIKNKFIKSTVDMLFLSSGVCMFYFAYLNG